jgi:hypothetical protein
MASSSESSDYEVSSDSYESDCPSSVASKSPKPSYRSDAIQAHDVAQISANDSDDELKESEVSDYAWKAPSKYDRTAGSAPSSAHPTYPFPNYSTGILHAYDIATPASRKSFNLLWALLSDPKFDFNEIKSIWSTGAAFRRSMEGRIPHQDFSVVSVNKQRLRRVRKNTLLEEQKIDPSAPHLRSKKVSLEINRVQGFVRRMYANPLTRKWIGPAVTHENPPTRFSATPLAREPFKFSRDVTAFLSGVEYSVGDFVKYRIDPGRGVRQTSATAGIGRLEFFKHIPGNFDSDDPWPVRVVVLRVTRKVSRSRFAHEVVLQFSTVEKRFHERFILGKVEVVCNALPRQAIPPGAIVLNKSRTQNGSNVTYEPVHPIFQYKQVLDRQPFLWAIPFQDAFSMKTSRQYSVDALLLQWGNVDPRLANKDSFIHTVMAIAPGVSTVEAMKVFRQDVRVLAREGVQVFDCFLGDWVTVKVGLGMLRADLVQVYKQCGHMGNNALKNCPQCTVSKEDRINILYDVQEKRRSKAQTTMIRQQIRTELRRAQPSDTENKDDRFNIGEYKQHIYNEIRKKYGINLGKSLYHGLDVDAHKQSVRDSSHLFLYGILKRLLSYFYKQVLKPKGRAQFLARVKAFPWSNTSLFVRVLNSASTSKFSSSMSMEAWKQYAMVCLTCLDGLIDRGLLKHFTATWFFYLDSTSPDGIAGIPEWKRLVQTAKGIVGTGSRLIPSVWNVPNGHGVLEFAINTLWSTMNGSLTSVSQGERHHNVLKTKGKNAGTKDVERHMMQRLRSVESLRYAFCGGTWGDKHSLKLGTDLLNAQVDGEEHPVILALSPLRRMEAVEKRLQNTFRDLAEEFVQHDTVDSWRPVYRKSVILKEPADMKSDNGQLFASVKAFVRDVYKDEISSFNQALISVTRLSSIQRTESISHKQYRVGLGDYVCMDWVEPGASNLIVTDAYCQVRALLKVSLRLPNGVKSHLLFVPYYFYRKFTANRPDLQRHTQRRTVFVKRVPQANCEPAQWCFAIKYRVLMVHSCNFSFGNCYTVCQKHGRKECHERLCNIWSGKSKTSLKAVCERRINKYEVFDRGTGFFPTVRHS